MRVLSNTEVSMICPMEHRQGRRYRSFLLAEIVGRRGRCAGIIYNVSQDGMFIVSQYPPQLNEGVDLYVSLDKEDGEPVRLTGVVVHRNDNGFGLMLCELENPLLKKVSLRRHDGADGGEPGIE